MPLDTQTVTVPLAQGIDSKPDPKQLPIGKLTSLKNATFRSPNRLSKRPAHTSLTSLSAGCALFTIDQQLLAHDGSGVRTLTSVGWASNTVPTPAISQTQRQIVQSTDDQLNPDMATASGITCVVWETSDAAASPDTLRAALINSTTGAPYQLAVGIVSLGSGTVFLKPRVLALGTTFVVFYVADSSTLRYVTFDAANPSSSNTPAVTVATLDAAAYYDAEVIGNHIVVAYNKVTASTIGIKTLDANLTLGTEATFTGPASGCIAVFADGVGGNVTVAWYDGSAVKFTVRSSDVQTQVVAPTTIETQASAVTQITGASQPGGSSWVWWWISGAADKPLHAAQIINDSPQAAAECARGAIQLGGKAFWMGSSPYVPALYAPTGSLEPTYFLVSPSGQAVAKMLPLVSGPGPSRHVLPETLVSGSSVQMPLGTRNLQTGEGVSTVGITDYTLTFGSTPPSTTGAAGSLLWSGGCLWMHDGVAPVEHGFHIFPEGVTFQSPSSTGAFAYSYAVTYEWMDNKGNIHRSAPSAPVTQKQANAIDVSHSIVLYVPRLPLTAKVRFAGSVVRSPVLVGIYRTLANGSIYYLVGFQENGVGWDGTGYAFGDAKTDAQIQVNAQLYTTGGVVDNIASGPFLAMTQYANRVIGIDAENPLVLWRSQQIIPGSPVEFSDSLKLNLDARLKAATALAVLDEKLIVFGASNIAVLTGQGPDRSGNNDDMGSGYVLPSDVGCIDARSIVQASSGIGFKSSKGYYLLDRSLGIQYIGAEVESFNSSTIVRGLIDPNRTQARLMLSTGTELVYDDRAGQWSTFPQESSGTVVDCTLWQGVPVYLKSDGSVFQEVAGTFSGVPLSFTTGWISFAGLSGFQRVKRLALLGDWISSHSLTVTVDSAVDSFDAPVTDTYSISATSGPEQWRIKLKTQKCQAIRVTVTETPGSGEGLSLSGISLEVGIRKGMAKLPATRSL